jgi:hypothetical protein
MNMIYLTAGCGWATWARVGLGEREEEKGWRGGGERRRKGEWIEMERAKEIQ